MLSLPLSLSLSLSLLLTVNGRPAFEVLLRYRLLATSFTRFTASHCVLLATSFTRFTTPIRGPPQISTLIYIQLLSLYSIYITSICIYTYMSIYICIYII